MSLPSPACTINGSATPPAIAVAAGSTVTIALAQPAGAQSWSLLCTSTDETNTTAAINATLVVNQTTKTATFTAPATLGSAVILTSIVGVGASPGLDGNRISQPALTTTLKVNVLTTGGAAVLAANEQGETNALFGWIQLINALVRLGGVPISTVGAYTLVAESANFTAAANTLYLVDTTSGPVTCTVPTSLTAGQWFAVVDWKGKFATHNLTVTAGTGWQIRDPNPLAYSAAAGSVVLSIAGTSVSWVSDGTSLLPIAP